MIDLDFGPDGALYVADYGGSNFAINNANNSVRRFAYIGGADTPGPDPQFVAPANQASTTFSFNIGKSGGVSYEWKFSDGGTATGASVTHTYLSAGNATKPTAKLIVTYADGATAEKTIDVPVPTTVPDAVTADVAKTLGFTLDAAARFGAFVPGTSNNYGASVAANVISTLPNATLSVVDLTTGAASRAAWSTRARRSRARCVHGRRTRPTRPRVREHLGESVDAADLGRTHLQRCGVRPVLAADRGERSPEGRAVQQDRDVHALDVDAVSLSAT